MADQRRLRSSLRCPFEARERLMPQKSPLAQFRNKPEISWSLSSPTNHAPLLCGCKCPLVGLRLDAYQCSLIFHSISTASQLTRIAPMATSMARVRHLRLNCYHKNYSSMVFGTNLGRLLPARSMCLWRRDKPSLCHTVITIMYTLLQLQSAA